MAMESTLAPLISAQLSYLISHFPLPIKVDQVWSGAKNPNLYNDRFSLLIPFCLDYIKWDVIYNAQCPLIAPDVIFGEEDDMFQPFVGVGDVQGAEVAGKKNCLCDWNSRDPARLFLLINELRDLYLSFQKKKIGELEDERLTFELSTILTREEIEVCIIPGPDKPEEVKFSVPLDINLNKLVHGCPWTHPQKIYLQVVFPVSKKYSLSPSVPRIKLVSSSELKALFPIDDVKLPQWLNGMCLAEYLPTIEDNLKIQIVESVASIGARRRFIEALALPFGRPVEADPVFCRKVTFLGGSGAFTFLVHFSLSTQFPKQQPVVALQSSQHFNSQGSPITSPSITNYPWSPRWEVSQMAERIFEFLTDECLSFKKFCNDTILQLS